ncbi:MAG: NAD-dependent epimerase/dehydratase family protein [Lentisphaerae bacterium]|nr:MAG: NAD-dependent epimerase/dehydratase family protein [Lentisphaerota bacterium]
MKKKPKQILITGGAGFIGSHLAELLLDRGEHVSVIDDLSTGSIENIAHLLPHENFHFARADINDLIVLDRLASQADVIVHLAAAVGVMLIVEEPVRTISTNIRGTEVVLEAALRYGARVLIASTSEVYGKGSAIPFSEDDDVVLGPSCKSRWSYAASKMVDEFLAFAYYEKYGLPVIPFRLFNTVGARQTGRYGMVIPRFVRQALAGEKITVFGDGQQSRCFCDVRDVVRALHGLMESDQAPGKLFNIGSTFEVSIEELAKRIIQLTGSNSQIVHIPYDQAYAPGFEDMPRRVPDISRINKLLGWQPQYSLDDILTSVIDYETHRNRGSKAHE